MYKHLKAVVDEFFCSTWWRLMSTSLDLFSFLLATVFYKTQKSLQKSRAEYYWYILCPRIKLRSVQTTYIISDILLKKISSWLLWRCKNANSFLGFRIHSFSAHTVAFIHLWYCLYIPETFRLFLHGLFHVTCLSGVIEQFKWAILLIWWCF